MKRVTRAIVAGAALGALLLVVALAALFIQPASAQEPEGRISGSIIPGTAGADPGDVLVRLLILEDSAVTGDEQTTATDGAFEFTVPATARRSYVVTTQYEGVQYIGHPIVLSADAPDAVVDLTLYETTDTAPDLRILETVVTVVALDRARSEIWLRREDTVSVPGDRVYAGGEEGVTLRIPPPEGTTEVNGGTLDGGVVSTSVPLFPGDNNVVVTAYIVRYDPAADEYGVRITAPAPTDHVELRVPEGYVHRVDPLEDARPAEDVVAEEAEETVLQVVSLDGPIDPGRGLLANLVGLSGERTVHPLTSQPGAGIAAAVALVVITGTAALTLRRRGDTGDLADAT